MMHTRIHNLNRRGIALLLVLAVIAMAAVFGFALLSSTSLQAQVGGNSTKSAEADYMGESGLQAAMYFLQYPQRTPAGWDTTAGYVLYAVNQEADDASMGSFDVEVTTTAARNVYDIKATGRGPTGALTKAAGARISVDRVKIGGAAYFGGPIVIPQRTTVTGPVQANGTITNSSGTALTSTSVAPLAATAYQVPTVANVNWFGADGSVNYTTPDGLTGQAQQLSSAPTSTPTAAVTNPGKIFYYVGDLTLNSGVTIDGTLIVKNGSLTIKAPGVVVDPVDGYPAVMVEKDLIMYRTSVSLQTEGSTFVGRHISRTGPSNSSSTLTINGALLMPAGSQLGAPNAGGAQTVSYTDGQSDIADLSRSLQPGKTVKILSWNQ